MMEPRHDYIGRCKDCNGIVGWASSGLASKELAKTLASWARRGHSIERMSTEDVRMADFGHETECPCHPAEKKKR